MKTIPQRIHGIIQHINHVRDNCLILGEKLIASGKSDMGRLLIANGFIHDNSKFYGVEWDFLSEDIEDAIKLKIAISQHGRTNQHHPEYWGGIENMPELYIAEMVCDWKARSSEFGTSIHQWIIDVSLERFKYNTESKVYKSIMMYIDMLCETPFTKSN